MSVCQCRASVLVQTAGRVRSSASAVAPTTTQLPAHQVAARTSARSPAGTGSPDSCQARCSGPGSGESLAAAARHQSRGHHGTEQPDPGPTRPHLAEASGGHGVRAWARMARVHGIASYAGFAAGLLTLTGLTVAIGRWARIGLGWFPLVVVVRATVQLSVIALLLRGILAVPWTVAAFVVLMLTTASWTSGRRLRELWHGRRIAVAGVLSGAGIALVLIFALQLVDLDVRDLVAVAGIVIGNSMSAATLTGRNFRRTVARAARRGRGLALARRHARTGARGDRARVRPRVTAADARPDQVHRAGHPAGRLRRRPVRRRLTARGRAVPAGGPGRGRARDDGHRRRRLPHGRPHAVRRGGRMIGAPAPRGGPSCAHRPRRHQRPPGRERSRRSVAGQVPGRVAGSSSTGCGPAISAAIAVVTGTARIRPMALVKVRATSSARDSVETRSSAERL